MRYTLLIAFAAITLRWLLHADNAITDGHTFSPIHLLALLFIVFFAQHAALRKDREITFPMLVRTGFRNAAVYALLIAVFAYVLYVWIDPLYFPIHINDRVDMAIADGIPEADARQRFEAIFSPLNYATITLVAFMGAGIVYALLVGALHHKMLRKLG
ncbi:MAG: DUF4199 family protein [Flavobacteriales bacterium]